MTQKKLLVRGNGVSLRQRCPKCMYYWVVQARKWLEIDRFTWTAYCSGLVEIRGSIFRGQFRVFLGDFRFFMRLFEKRFLFLYGDLFQQRNTYPRPIYLWFISIKIVKPPAIGDLEYISLSGSVKGSVSTKFAAIFSEFRRLKGSREAEGADPRARLALLEEKAEQHHLATDFGSLAATRMNDQSAFHNEPFTCPIANGQTGLASLMFFKGTRKLRQTLSLSNVRG